MGLEGLHFPVSTDFTSKGKIQMAKKEKEVCPRCGKSEIVKANDKSGKLYCQTSGCMYVWVPGMENLNRADLVLKQAQTENQELKAAINSERAENKKLKARVQELEDKYEPKPASEDEIFS